MSYDISFKAKIEGIDQYVPVGECTANITWNVRKIIELSTGLPWKNEENNGLVKDVIPHIAHGLTELVNHPEKYMRYEAPNGWGTVKGTINFFETILKDWEHLRYCYGDELANVVTFWIE
jgi:hypothetical protein